MEQYKLMVFQVAPPLFLLGFILFTRFVKNRLPAKYGLSWTFFCIGGFLAIAGLAVAVYFDSIELGAKFIFLGVVIGAGGVTSILFKRGSEV